MFTLFGAILTSSNLYKKTIFKEIPTQAIYINMKSVCFAIQPIYYLAETSFSFYNIPLEKDCIAKLGNKIVYKKGNIYTCNNTCKSLFMSMLSTSAHF